MFKTFLNKIVSKLIAELISFATAAGTTLVGGRFLGLFRSTETYGIPGIYEWKVYWLIDEGMIAFIVSVGGAMWAANIAAKNTNVGHSAILGLLSGLLVAVIILTASKIGLSEGWPIAIVGVVTSLAVGHGLKAVLNPCVRENSGK